MNMRGGRFKFWAVLFVGLGAVVIDGAVLADKSSKGNESQGGGQSGNQVNISVRLITVTTANSRRLGIDWVALSDGQSTLFADAGKGVSQEDQDRLDLSFVPLFGQATGRRYTAADVAPVTRVGSAWFLDRVLFVALDPARMSLQNPPEIVVLNGKFAFVMNASATRLDWVSRPEIDSITGLRPFRDFASNVSVPESRAILIGGLDSPGCVEAAYRVPMLSEIPGLKHMFAGSAHRRENNQLVILIKPSIIAPDN